MKEYAVLFVRTLKVIAREKGIHLNYHPKGSHITKEDRVIATFGRGYDARRDINKFISEYVP